jgi:hypothetical protein
MAEFFDISSWQEKKYLQTRGARDKNIFESPEGDLYYFKISLKRYEYEFWSEILASEIGKELGFNTLRYDIAYHDNERKIGCLSRSMVEPDQRLSEIIDYLRGYDNSFNPDDKDTRPKYTFQFIEKALTGYRLQNNIHHIITTIIFDSIIGNGDRHQENWAFIVPNTEISKKEKSKTTEPKMLKALFGANSSKPSDESMDVFSPIYDNGSCLGREHLNQKVDEMLDDEGMIRAYINKGNCRVYWEGNGKRICHFQMIESIKNERNHRETVEAEIKRLRVKYNQQQIDKVIDNIDKNLPDSLIKHKLPANRKELIKKIVTLRYEKLQEIVR